MVELERLSKIGFGTYRISNNKDHLKALNHALKTGCNLIDTSISYGNGEAEKAIGKVIKENKADAFIITKAGYINNDDTSLLQYLSQKGIKKKDLVPVSELFSHSIHPDYLNYQINASLNRLQRKYIDGFLIHNPEYYLLHTPNNYETKVQEEYYNRLGKAFEFLEEKVKEGVIRYYGISSNTFPQPTTSTTSTNLLKVLHVANKISDQNHFKLIQFPHNIYENGASKDHHEGQSLLSLAKMNGITTFGNRPLNVQTNEQFIRLATYEYKLSQINEKQDQQLWMDCFANMERQLKSLGGEDNLLEFEIIHTLHLNWKNIANQSAVQTLFNEHFFPFIEQLYEGKIPQKEKKLFNLFYERALLYTLKKMTRESENVKQLLHKKNIIKLPDSRPLPTVVCDYYLKQGIDHVLVGMRETSYVDELKQLF